MGYVNIHQKEFRLVFEGKGRRTKGMTDFPSHLC